MEQHRPTQTFYFERKMNFTVFSVKYINCRLFSRYLKCSIFTVICQSYGHMAENKKARYEVCRPNVNYIALSRDGTYNTTATALTQQSRAHKDGMY